ncbi:hypothetical protein GCM10027190_55420 [Spirosoma areae]
MFDEAFKKMAVELSYLKGSVRQAADELGIDASRISQWRQRKKKPEQPTKSPTELTDEQKQIKRLQKEPLRRPGQGSAVGTGYPPAVSIFSKSDGNYSDL